jgi:hypothetical protein
VPTIATSMEQIDVNPRFSRILRSYSCPAAFLFGWCLETCRSRITSTTITRTTTPIFPEFLDVSPLGPYCKECRTLLAVERGIYFHGKDKHSNDSFKNALLVREVNRQVAELRQAYSRDFSPFLVPGSPMNEMGFCRIDRILVIRVVRI